MLTPKQVQDSAKISATTLRRYVTKFGKHLSDTATKKRGRKFSAEDMAKVLKIKQLYADGFSDDQISQQLSLVEQGSADTSDLAILYPAIAPALQEALDTARAAAAGIDEMHERQDRTDYRVIQQAEEIAKLRAWLVRIAIVAAAALVILYLILR